MLSSLSAFFPVYNEEANIPELVDSACAYLSKVAKKFEIILVDDGSTDKTRKVAAAMITSCPHLRIVSHRTNRGYGSALRTGIKHAKHQWTFWMDGDLQFRIQTIEKLLPYSNTYDAVIGYRAHRADTFLRKVNGELYTRLINVLFGLNVRDIDCAFKLIRTEKLQSLQLESSSAFTSAEILIKLKEVGTVFKQIPVPHYPRKYGNPTGGSMRVIFKGLRQTVQFFLFRRM